MSLKGELFCHLCVQEFLLTNEAERLDSMDLLRIMAFIAVLLLLPAIVLFEPGASATALRLLHMQPAFGLLLMANSSMAYIVNYLNFQITKCSSALSLQV